MFVSVTLFLGCSRLFCC